MSVKSIKGLPFPDLYIQTRAPYTIWKTVAHYAKEADKEEEIKELYERIPKLKYLLQKSAYSGATFKIFHDDWSFSMFCDSLAKKIGLSNTTDFCRNSMDMEDPARLKSLHDNAGPFIKSYLTTMNNNAITKVDELTTLLSLDIFLGLESNDLIEFLTNVMSKGPKFLREHFTSTDMNLMYTYISEVSLNLDVFNHLPIPVGILLTAQGRRSDKTD